MKHIVSIESIRLKFVIMLIFITFVIESYGRSEDRINFGESGWGGYPISVSLPKDVYLGRTQRDPDIESIIVGSTILFEAPDTSYYSVFGVLSGYCSDIYLTTLSDTIDGVYRAKYLNRDSIPFISTRYHNKQRNRYARADKYYLDNTTVFVQEVPYSMKEKVDSILDSVSLIKE